MTCHSTTLLDVPDNGTWHTRVLSKRDARQHLTAINISADDSWIAYQWVVLPKSLTDRFNDVPLEP